MSILSTDKITITDKLRIDIVERRKNRGLSSYELSERTGNGHSKFWLQNIESGKTKKITKQDLISLYMIVNNEDDPHNSTNEIEHILNQPIGTDYKQWYELVTISDDFAENYDDEDLMDTLDEFWEEKITPSVRNAVFGMSVNQKQAALTAIQNFYYSLYKNPELAFALINIPIYGVKEMDVPEHNTALNDLLAISAKYNDLVIKNNSLQTINDFNKFDEYYKKIDQQNIHLAFKNFKKIIQIILKSKDESNPNMHEIVNNFNVDVTFMIERGQPNVMKHYLKSFHIYDGQGFTKHIKECVAWFVGFEHEYELPFLYDEIDNDTLETVYNYLNGFGEIRPMLK
ncbi:MAG: hypothetical protein PHW34_14030 [Hespellia sp.]|nr:hypothetical protein [Hespellia sp.]